MTESQFWAAIRKGMGKRWDAERVENGLHAGTPDVNYGVPNHQGWIELKVLQALPKKRETPVKIQHWTSEQQLWMRNRGRVSGHVWLLIWIAEEVFLFTWEQALECESWPIRDWRKYAQRYWCGQIDYDQLYATLNALPEPRLA